jgi:hypothetical protein
MSRQDQATLVLCLYGFVIGMLISYAAETYHQMLGGGVIVVARPPAAVPADG